MMTDDANATDGLWTKMNALVDQAHQYSDGEKVMLVNRVMHDKIHARLTEMGLVDTPAKTLFGLPAPLTINFMTGAVEVHVVGPFQYVLYGNMNPDTSVLLVPRKTWDIMCGRVPLWEQSLEYSRRTSDVTT